MDSTKFTKALRQLADWYEAHPEMPAPSYHVVNVFPDVTEVVTVARNCGGFRKRATNEFVWLERNFEDSISLQVNFARDAVCTRRVVGTREVPEHITAAHTIDVVEWDCHPLLSDNEE